MPRQFLREIPQRVTRNLLYWRQRKILTFQDHREVHSFLEQMGRTKNAAELFSLLPLLLPIQQHVYLHFWEVRQRDRNDRSDGCPARVHKYKVRSYFALYAF